MLMTAMLTLSWQVCRIPSARSAEAGAVGPCMKSTMRTKAGSSLLSDVQLSESFCCICCSHGAGDRDPCRICISLALAVQARLR